MEIKKTHIYLASDSTVQSYAKTYYPQTGWGQVFVQFFKNSDHIEVSQPTSCSYSLAKRYETDSLVIENRSIGGRSSRSFIEEGKLDELLQVIEAGDYLFVQFGHNDASIDRPNRYVSVEDFPLYIQKYIDACKERNVTCVLVTPVARRNCDENNGEFKISFSGYRDAMIRISEEQNIPLLDLGYHSYEYLKSTGIEESKELYMWVEEGEYPDGAHKDGLKDNTHLSRKGALIYAEILTKLILAYNKDSQLDEIKALLS